LPTRRWTGLADFSLCDQSVLDIRQGQPIEIEFATDSPLEEAGFELVVPL